MNQEKIGKLIASCRKGKKLTQEQLAERLNTTSKSVSRWENGRTMPDLSLFKPLCEILDISINELLSGERITNDKNQEMFEENIVNTIDYTSKKIGKYSNFMGILLVIFGVFISMSAIMIFPSESSWGSIYSVFGVMIFVVGISKLTRNIKYYKRLFLIVVIFVGTLGILIFTDYINVKYNNEGPMFRKTSVYVGSDSGNVYYYDAIFYDVIRCNDKYNIVNNKKYSEGELIDYCVNYT